MGLKYDYRFRGVTVKDAYVRLDDIEGGKQGWLGKFGVYISPETVQDGPIFQFQFPTFGVITYVPDQPVHQTVYSAFKSELNSTNPENQDV